MSDRDAFLTTVREALSPFPRRRARIVRELADHLDELTTSLVRQGTSRADAEREAVRRLGEPQALAAEFAADIASRRSVGLTRILGGSLAIWLVSVGLVPVLVRINFLPLPEDPYSSDFRVLPELDYRLFRWFLLVPFALYPAMTLAMIGRGARRVVRWVAFVAAAGWTIAMPLFFFNPSVGGFAYVTVFLGTYGLAIVAAVHSVVGPGASAGQVPYRLAVASTLVTIGAAVVVLGSPIPVPHSAKSALWALPPLTILVAAPLALVALLAYAEARSAAHAISRRAAT